MVDSIQEYGASKQHVVVSLNYLNAFRERYPPPAKAILLHGPPGVGKTTLVHLLAKELDWPLVETNASLSIDFSRMGDALTSRPLTAEHKIVFFDECDNLTTTQQKKLVALIGGAKDPVFLACNDIRGVDKTLKDACMTLFVGGASYREGIEGSDDVTVIDDAQDRLIRRLKGEEVPINPGEYWSAGAWILDNTTGAEPLTWDEWQARYRRAGRTMTKYVLRAFPRVPEPQFPWSVFIRKPVQKSEKPPPVKKTRASAKKAPTKRPSVDSVF